MYSSRMDSVQHTPAECFSSRFCNMWKFKAMKVLQKQLMQKVQALWTEPLQKNQLPFEAFYVQPTVLNITFN